MNKDSILNILTVIAAIAVFLAFLAFVSFAIKSCDEQYTNYQNSRPTYNAMYGSFLNGRSSIDFETYKVENNHYTFFDSNDNIVGDFTVSGNNQISIIRNLK